jgi:hypothetical protein
LKINQKIIISDSKKSKQDTIIFFLISHKILRVETKIDTQKELSFFPVCLGMKLQQRHLKVATTQHVATSDRPKPVFGRRPKSRPKHTSHLTETEPEPKQGP